MNPKNIKILETFLHFPKGSNVKTLSDGGGHLEYLIHMINIRRRNTE